jgi:alpha-1,3-rhamnosyl/mannosyltransferase
MRIGFDVAQTCVERAGCPWYADALIRAMVKLAPRNHYILYHHFDAWINSATDAGTDLSGAAVEQPLRALGPQDAQRVWAGVRSGDPLPGNPEIVHANCHQAPRIRGAKLVFTVYDTSFWMVPEFASEANRLVCQAGVLKALANADGFVFISQCSRDEFERILPGWLERAGRPWAVTPLGPRSGPAAVARPERREHWLAVGSLEPRKNYEALLDAMEIYWERSPRRLPLRIAGGNGWKSDSLRRRIASLGQRGLAAHLGYVPDAELPGLYARAEALVFPSWYEGFGLPIIEAMARGCPVISSDRASMREVGGEAPLYVDPGRPADIAGAMLRIEREPELRAKSAQAGIRRAAGFDWSRTAELTLEFYERVLKTTAVARD